jgi:membrane-anchored protein YejM (alkaline phosphatase superfamily)
MSRSLTPTVTSFLWLAFFSVLAFLLPLMQYSAYRSGAANALYCFALWVSYGALFWSPVWLATAIGNRLGNKARAILPVVALGVVQTLLYADNFIYEIYGFHINGFVLNLVFTPGGIDSLGGSDGTQLVFAGKVAAFFALSALLWWIASTLLQRFAVSIRKRYLWLLFLLLALGERATYGLANIYGYAPVLTSASAMPAYQPMTFKRFAKTLGVDAPRDIKYKNDDSLHLNYPRAPLAVDKPQQPLNVIWLVSESWRWDMLDPRIMPATWQFAGEAARFTNHFSGGNGTRMGMFTLFYGLHGPYWFPMLKETQPPVVMDLFRQQGYQWQMYTSAKFSYPEFDKTIFAGVESSAMDDINQGVGWKDDRHHVDQMLQFIEQRDQSRPFMTFMFFESPHARYYFPDETVVEKDYLADFNYATMDLERDIVKIKNRYINSCNHLDSQFARVISYLRDRDLLKNTVVILTGDHGEEFLENGRWGHNSMFHNQQVHTPLVVWMPGMTPAVYEHATSHIDWVPTLLPLMGVKNPAGDYSQGKSLFDASPRDYRVSSDWSSIAIMDDKYKIRMPLSSSGALRNEVTDANDKAIENTRDVMVQSQHKLIDVMKSLSTFRQK